MAKIASVFSRLLAFLYFVLFSVNLFVECFGLGASILRNPAMLQNNLLSKGSKAGRNVLSMGMEITIRIVGKKNSCENWLQDAYSVYETRLQPSTIKVETAWCKNNDKLIMAVESDFKKGHTIVLLDSLGKTISSEKLSERLYDWLETGGSRLTFVIGGANGLPYALKENFSEQQNNSGRKGTAKWESLSLSALTFTHQFSRTMLMEQIYRASEIRKGW